MEYSMQADAGQDFYPEASCTWALVHLEP